ncbi:MAG: hypothetical protein ABIQ02_07475, partial [Saprospiraceae bacterium]
MITEKRKWITYTYFNRNPEFLLNKVHLFSPVKKNIEGMHRIPFPTMILDIQKENFLDAWSKSTRYKVNRAEKEGLVIERVITQLPEILNLFQKTAEVKKLRGYTIDDFHSKPWIDCSAVYADDKILAGHVWILDPDEKRCLLFVNA